MNNVIIKCMRKILPVMALMAVAGCTTLPAGPSVLVLPAYGKPFDVFQVDDGSCRQWANSRIGISPQDAANKSTASGAAVGTIVGGAVGAGIGAAAGDPAAGAAIGAGSGLLVGTASGSSAGQYSSYELQRRYDNAYVQCMYAKGNQIPGVVHRTKRARTPLPPPPPDYETPDPSKSR